MFVHSLFVYCCCCFFFTIHSFINPSIHSCIHSFIHSFIHSASQSVSQSANQSFVYSFIRSFSRSLTCVQLLFCFPDKVSKSLLLFNLPICNRNSSEIDKHYSRNSAASPWAMILVWLVSCKTTTEPTSKDWFYCCKYLLSLICWEWKFTSEQLFYHANLKQWN